jgi:membrane dipeptidase
MSIFRKEPPNNWSSLVPEATALHARSTIVDLHGDTLMWMKRGYDFFRRHRRTPLSAVLSHIDEPRMRMGGLTAQVFGLVTQPFGLGSAFRSASHQVELLHEAARAHPDRLRVVTEAAELRAASRAGARAGLLGLEGVHALEGDLDNLNHLAKRGLRLCGLSHFSKNPAAHPAIGWGRDDRRGLTPFGEAIIDRCHELGVLVDLAHINRVGFFEAARRSRNPVVVSHTGVCGVTDIRRNIDDEQIRAVADTGGVVGIIFAFNFVGGTTVEAVVNHIVHTVQVGGEDCAALGSDFDGAIIPVQGLSDVADLPNLTAALLARGLSPEAVQKILGKNVMRVLEGVRQQAYEPD